MKQSLYEFLGVAPDATIDQIEVQCQLHRQSIDKTSDATHRKNQLVFLKHAEDTLTNRDKRAQYDRQRQQDADVLEAAVVVEGVQSQSWGKPLLVGILTVAAALFAWGRFHPQAVVAPQAPLPGPAEIAQGADSEVTVEVPPEMMAAPPPMPMTAPVDLQTNQHAAPVFPTQTVKTITTYTVRTTGPYAKLLGKLVWSVFVIQGPRTFGSGVLIENEKLLTNCHTIAHNKGPDAKIYAINSVTHQRAEITEVAYLPFRGDDACVVIAPGLKGQPVALGSLSNLSVGSVVHNIGFPQGTLSASNGYVRGLTNLNGQDFIESSNYCEHGVSGGPLVDDNGRLVGLTTGGTDDHRKCFSLTIDSARPVLSEPTVSLSEFPAGYVSNVAVSR